MEKHHQCGTVQATAKFVGGLYFIFFNCSSAHKNLQVLFLCFLKARREKSLTTGGTQHSDPNSARQVLALPSLEQKKESEVRNSVAFSPSFFLWGRQSNRTA